MRLNLIKLFLKGKFLGLFFKRYREYSNGSISIKLKYYPPHSYLNLQEIYFPLMIISDPV